MADQEEKDEKTEEASPKRRSEARDKGQVALSTELVAAVGLCVGVASMVWSGSYLVDALAGGAVRTIRSLPTLGTDELDVPLGAKILTESLTGVLGGLALVTLPSIVIAGLTGYLQVGFKFAPKAVAPDITKFDLVKGAKKFVSMRSVMRTLLSTLKVILITSVVVVIAWSHVEGIIRSSNNELGPLMISVGHVAIRCVTGALVVILAISFVDFVFQRFQHNKDLRMSKKEVKEEAKQTEGDPKVKARIRQVQHEMANRRMMADVPDATVVVTNPTHYAVALRYERDSESAGAPKVVAKGADHLAQRIKATARAADVVCYEDVPLARALYAQAEVGQEIPEDLYAAVATVLGYVYQLRGMASGRAAAPAPATPIETPADAGTPALEV